MTFAEDVWQRRALLMKLARGDEDLVKDTILKAISSEHMFKPGSNLTAWLVTILKNRRSTLNRKYRREVPPLEWDPRSINPVGSASIEAREALNSLPQKMVKPLIVVQAYGYSYAEAFEATGVPMGTIKSRIHRASKHLEQN